MAGSERALTTTREGKDGVQRSFGGNGLYVQVPAEVTSPGLCFHKLVSLRVTKQSVGIHSFRTENKCKESDKPGGKNES